MSSISCAASSKGRWGGGVCPNGVLGSMVRWYALIWETPVAIAVCTSCKARAGVCAGRAYIKSIFTRSNRVRAVSMACKASRLLCMRPRAWSAVSLKLCTPMDKRVTPASWKPWNLSRSKVLGLASRVISACGCSFTKARTPFNRRLMAEAENTLGVPPPIKMVSTGRPQIWGNSLCKSLSSASI